MAEPNESATQTSDDLDSLLEEYSQQSETKEQEPVKVADHIKPDSKGGDPTQAEILNFIREQQKDKQRASEQKTLGNAVAKFKENEFFADVASDAIEELIAGRAWRDEKFLKVMQSGDEKAINKAVSKLAEERAAVLQRERQSDNKTKEAVRAAVSGINETDSGNSGDDSPEALQKKVAKMSDWEFSQFKKGFPRE